MTHVAMFEGASGGALGKRKGLEGQCRKSTSGSTSRIEFLVDGNSGRHWCCPDSRSRVYALDECADDESSGRELQNRRLNACRRAIQADVKLRCAFA